MGEIWIGLDRIGWNWDCMDWDPSGETTLAQQSPNLQYMFRAGAPILNTYQRVPCCGPERGG